MIVSQTIEMPSWAKDEGKCLSYSKYTGSHALILTSIPIYAKYKSTQIINPLSLYNLVSVLGTFTVLILVLLKLVFTLKRNGINAIDPIKIKINGNLHPMFINENRTTINGPTKEPTAYEVCRAEIAASLFL